MPRATLKCSKCNRKFGMAAHLARHMSAIHRAPGTKLRAGATAKKTGRRPGRPKGVRSKVTAQSKPGNGRRIQFAGDGPARVLREMQAYHGALMAEHTSLQARMDALTNAMATLGTVTPAGPTRTTTKRGRPAGSGVRPGSLKDHIVRVLRQTSKPIGPRDISKKVLRAGFKTKAKDISKAVSNKLPELKNVKKVGFGLYRITGS